MNVRIRLEPRKAQDLLQQLAGRHFAVRCEKKPMGRGLVQEMRYLEDHDAVHRELQALSGASIVFVFFEGDFRPPGRYPLDALTVVLRDDGSVANAFYG